MFQEQEHSQLLGKTQRFLLEFVTILYFIVKNSCIPLVQQYVYWLVDKKYNFTAQKAAILDGGLEKVYNAVQSANNSRMREDIADLEYLGHKCNEESSLIILYLNIAELLPSAIVVLILGAYSDMIGRRKFLMWLPCLGNAFYVLGFVLPLYICQGDIDHPATKALFVVAAILSKRKFILIAYKINRSRCT